MFAQLKTNLPSLLLFIGVISYILYFSLFTINRYQKLHAHYFDLGIMHHAVYNTYKGLETGNVGRILEITNPHTTANQVKRMSVHNDVTLALIAPLYFIHNGPETLLVLQSVTIGFGALFIYLITLHIIPAAPKRTWFALMFAYSYLLYPGLQKANNFDFHAVTLATSFLLAMYYYWLKKKYGWSIFFALMSVLTKEQVGLTVAGFGVYAYLHQATGVKLFFDKLKSLLKFKRTSIASSFIQSYFSPIMILLGVGWTYLSMNYIIPYFRGGEHFGTSYFTYLKDDPLQIFPVLFRYETWHYIFILLAPVGLLALVSLPHLLIVAPEFAINILSSNSNMRNIYFHYNSILTPFIFIASIYGVKNILNKKFTSPLAPLLTKEGNKGWLKLAHNNKETIVLIYLTVCTTIFTLYMSPLPWGLHRDMYPWQQAPAKLQDVLLWKEYLKDDQIKVSASGKLGPHFTSRQYYYDFSWKYEFADYIVLDIYDVEHGYMNHLTMPAYKDLQSDWRYIRIYNNNDIEVYKRI
ncbi:MAG: DUF2079 domain-containing protein [bacterium]|nr:DUF2079 domain-containing protein [bacterium]